jgi:ribosomal protein L37AE/L43A
VPYTRAEFDRLRALARRVERREGWVLAGVSVSLGLGQLAAIAWMDRHLPRSTRVGIEGAVFLAYMAIVLWLLWRMQRRVRATRTTCPQCHVALSEMSERVAVATGRCDSCGGRVLADATNTAELDGRATNT